MQGLATPADPIPIYPRAWLFNASRLKIHTSYVISRVPVGKSRGPYGPNCRSYDIPALHT
jgi:hypothetical protein